MSLSKRLRHNGLLVPHKPPFGTYSVSFCPVCIPSFEIAFFFFFPIFCFLWKRYFYWFCEAQLSFQGLSEIKSQSFRKNHKSIFTFYAFKKLMQIGKYLQACTPEYLQACSPTYLHACILESLHTCILAYLYTCILECLYFLMLAYLHPCILEPFLERKYFKIQLNYCII